VSNEEDKAELAYRPHRFLFDDLMDRSRKERLSHQIKKSLVVFSIPKPSAQYHNLFWG